MMSGLHRNACRPIPRDEKTGRISGTGKRYTGCCDRAPNPDTLKYQSLRDELHGDGMASESLRATDDVLRRVQGEFLEMPGLCLTPPQARRLWGLDAAACDALLTALVDAKFLFRTRDGAFMRVEYAAPVKAAPRQHF